MTQPTNPPAFPIGVDKPELHLQPFNYFGMTLRDYFASQCPGIDDESSHKNLTLSYPELGELPKYDVDPIGNANWWIKADVVYRFRWADAMLAERLKQ